MKKAFDMFALTKNEQRMVIVVMLVLGAIALAKHYRDVGTIVPAQQIGATPPPSPEEERTGPSDAR
jgi:hypothetical protein